MKKIVIFLTLILLSGCTKKYMNQYVFKPPKYLEKELIKTSSFLLLTHPKIDNPKKPVKIYLEGDGRAYITPYTISKDPTPTVPTGLNLALADNSNFIYIARPCQFTLAQDNQCHPKYWSKARYSSLVIESINETIDHLKNKYKFNEVELIGFSGGGGIAVIISALRNDVISLRTVAGNLNLKLMDEYHRSVPLSESLDPLDYAAQIKNIPQIHFIGKKDTVVPPIIAQSFLLVQKGNLSKIYETKFQHNKGWSENWGELLKEEFIKAN